MISFPCSHCQKPLKTRPDLAGKKVKCPGCGKGTPVPIQPSAGLTPPETKSPYPVAIPLEPPAATWPRQAPGFLSRIASWLSRTRKLWQWTSRLKTGSEQQRIEAAEALGHLADPRAIKALLSVLQFGPSATVRQAAVEALFRLRDARLVELLTPVLLNSVYQEVRQSVAVGLGRLGDPRATEPLAAVASDHKRPDVEREIAAEALGRLGDTRLVEIILRAEPKGTLNARNYSPNDLPVRMLTRLGAISVPPLLESLKGGGSWAESLVLTTLKQFGGEAVPPLLTALGKGDSERTVVVVRALGQIGDQRAVGPLLVTLKEASEEKVRIAAAEALGQLGDTGAVVGLAAALQDKRSKVAVAAAEALAALGDRRAVEPLIAALEASTSASHGDIWISWATAKALGQLGDGRAVVPLIAAVEGRRSKGVVMKAAEALASLGDRRAVEALVAALDAYTSGGDSDPSVVVVIAESLARLGDARAVEPLIAVLGRGGQEMVEAAAKALGKLGDARALVPLKEAYSRLKGSPNIAGILAQFGDYEALAGEASKNSLDAIRALGTLADAQVLSLLYRNLVAHMAEAEKRAYHGQGSSGASDRVEAIAAVLQRHVQSAAEPDLRDLSTLRDAANYTAVTICSNFNSTDKHNIDCGHIRQLARQELIRRGIKL